MVTLHPPSVALGFVLAGVFVILVNVEMLIENRWRERRARRKAVKDILSRAAVLHD